MQHRFNNFLARVHVPELMKFEKRRAISEIRSGKRSAVNAPISRMRRPSSPWDRKSSRTRCVTARRYTAAWNREQRRVLPLIIGKLLVLLGTNARRGASLPGGILLKLSITYRELTVISRHMYTLSSEERSSPVSVVPLVLSPRRDLSFKPMYKTTSLSRYVLTPRW